MLDKILEYQKLDREIINEETELAKSSDREKASKIQQTLKNQHAQLLALEEQAKKVNIAFSKATDKYQEFEKKLLELEKTLENAEDDKVALYEKTYKDFSAIAVSLDKEITNMYGEIQRINKDYEETMKKSKEDRIHFDKFKAAYDKFKSEKEPKIAELKKELQAKEKDIDPKLFAAYKTKRDGKLFPVFVPFNDKRCGGCRMEISASKIGQIKSSPFGVVECENCGRFVYNK